MANGKNTAAFIILTILAVGGLGLSGYMFVEDQFLGGDEYVPEHEHDLIPHDHEMYTLVGIWDELEGSGTDFNLTFQDLEYQNSEYFSLSTANDTITLLQEGWYKFTIATTWISLDSSNYYDLYAKRNGTTIHGLVEISYPPSAVFTTYLVFFVYSEGNDDVWIECQSSGDTYQVAPNDQFNHAYLEYVITD